MGHREPSNAEHIGVLREVDAPAWPPKNEPLGAVVSADVPSVSPVASVTYMSHTARQVRLRLGAEWGSVGSNCDSDTALRASLVECRDESAILDVELCDHDDVEIDVQCAGGLRLFANLYRDTL